MNNKLSGSDFREEELFRRFLEKEKNHTDASIFDADFENEVSAIEKNSEFNEADADTKEKKRELLSDLILRLPKNKESYKGILGKIRYAFQSDHIRCLASVSPTSSLPISTTSVRAYPAPSLYLT